MPFWESFWKVTTYLVSIVTLSPLEAPQQGSQVPIVRPVDPILPPVSEVPEIALKKGPVFKPPTGRPSGDGSDFVCDYSNMPGFQLCSAPDDRGCWLNNSKTGVRYDINTNYEDVQSTPNGTERKYEITVTDEHLNADGILFTEAKLFNKQYPGPWIQACWGDTVTVTIHNKLKYNGTSIHWHGIRQLLSTEMDGVNGVTQCPIAPGQSFTYSWRALQYGSSWYHSHYSVQYADGALGPMTLHGPSTAPYDEAKVPILMTDWGHDSAFRSIQLGFNAPGNDPSTLLNGVGNITRYNNSIKAQLPIPKPYTINFEPAKAGQRAKRYLLRLINTSFESTFVFSIDNHRLQIVGADFVPIHPYFNTSVLVSIGQRYHVIVEANPDASLSPLPSDGNYWIRVWRANCFLFPTGDPGYERAGILSYKGSTTQPNTTAWPNIALNCSDETYTSLKPWLPWTVGSPANVPAVSIGENLTVQFNGNGASIFPLAKFSMGGDTFNPLQIDYGDPTFLNLNYTGKWPPLWVVFPENFNSSSWVWLVLRGLQGNSFGAHPIHLHGHDFAILQQIENATFPNKLDLKLDNPPRRDVVLLPTNGYVVIGFKTDNPGTWLMHCHIAFHASFGLALQILERQRDAANLWPSVEASPPLRNAQETCNAWNKWWGDCRHWWPGDGSECDGGEHAFSPDSGI